MKRNWIILGALVMVALFAGQTFTMTFRAEISENDSTVTSITTGVPFKVDIYMNNNDSVAADPTRGYRLAYSTPFAFYDSSGMVTTVTHVDVGGSADGSLEYVNGFDAFWSMILIDSRWSWDGTLPDSINITGIGGSTSGMPFDLGEQLYIRFAYQIDETGHFCIDSIDGRTSTYDWLLDDPSPPFGGPYCWQVNEYQDVGDDRDNNLLPNDFELSQNRPNPFNPSTVINFALPERSNVIINVYNVLGQKITTLTNEEYSAGYHSETWDGTTGSGIPAASGIYFYKIIAGEFADTKKMILLK